MMLRSKRKALRSLTSSKVVNIGDYRNMKNGRQLRKMAVVATDPQLMEGIKAQLAQQAEVTFFDGRFSLEQAVKSSEWDGVLLDERLLKEDALSLCEKLKRQSRLEETFVVILSDKSEKDLMRQGYEKGCDEWITRTDDPVHLAHLLAHHLSA